MIIIAMTLPKITTWEVVEGDLMDQLSCSLMILLEGCKILMVVQATVTHSSFFHGLE